jgi:hypothetical protein
MVACQAAGAVETASAPKPPRVEVTLLNGVIRIMEDDPIRSVTDSSGATWASPGLCCSPDTPYVKGKPMRIWSSRRRAAGRHDDHGHLRG